MNTSLHKVARKGETNRETYNALNFKLTSFFQLVLLWIMT